VLLCDSNRDLSSLTVQEAQAKLSELIHNLKPGDEVVITDNDQPVARLVPAEQRQRGPGVLARFGAQ